MDLANAIQQNKLFYQEQDYLFEIQKLKQEKAELEEKLKHAHYVEGAYKGAKTKTKKKKT